MNSECRFSASRMSMPSFLAACSLAASSSYDKYREKGMGGEEVNEGEKKRVNQGDKIWSLEVDGWVANSSSYSGLHDNTPFSRLLSLPPSFGFFCLYLIFPSSSSSSFSVELSSSLPFVLPQLSDELWLLIYESLRFLLPFECEFVKCVFLLQLEETLKI